MCLRQSAWTDASAVLTVHVCEGNRRANHLAGAVRVPGGPVERCQAVEHGADDLVAAEGVVCTPEGLGQFGLGPV